jgi:MFS family permease
MTLDFLAVFWGGVIALLPAFAQDILKISEFEMGWLRSSPALGALLAALILPLIRKKFNLLHHAGRNMILAVFFFGLFTLVFAFSGDFSLSLAALFLTGAVDHLSVVIRGAIVAHETPPEKLGRINAINSVFISASNELGDFQSGLTAKLFGLVNSAAFGGVGCWMALGLVTSQWKKLWHYKVNS